MTLAGKPSPAERRQRDAHSWIGTETVHTRLGTFEFRNGYPQGETVRRLRDALAFNRAVEVYLAQMPAVSWYRVWKGVAKAGGGVANQLVIWESLMDAETILLTGNSETVYGLCSFDLRRDGPVVIEAPPMLLGGINDLWQREIMGIGPTGADKGQGGKFLLLPPGYKDPVPEGYFVGRSRCYEASMGMRGFQADGKPDRAVALMKSIKVYPFSESQNPPRMTFLNGSHKPIDTLFSDTYEFFEDLAWLIAHEPEDVVSPQERFQLAGIGIGRYIKFLPDTDRRWLLAEAARSGSAIARANTFASSDEARLVYADRRWETLFIGGSASWDAQGYVNSDRRAAFAYAAIGMSPAMADKIVGGGSQYLWTARDHDNEFLDGAGSYRLHLPPQIPAKNFWSVVVYDAESRSMLRNGQKFPAVSQYTSPSINDDGSIDIYFGPKPLPDEKKNWIETVPGKGWFTLLRFYGPLEAFFDKSWKPGDIILLETP